MKPHIAHMIRLFKLLSLLLLVCSIHPAQTHNTSLAELQRAYAMRYLEPEPHMALAKYYFEHGNRIEAFWVVEAARRGRFEEKIFDPAFYRAFDGFDNSEAAKARLLAEYKRNPDSIETIDALADIYISRNDWPNAKRYLFAAIQKKPDDYRFISGLAMILESEGKPQEAEQVNKDYLKKFPNTAEGYAIRAERVAQTNPVEAKTILTEAVAKFPEDGQLLFKLGAAYQTEDQQKAEQAFVKAAEVAPKSELIQTWVGRFFFKVKSDNRRALEYYLNAYFLNPHAYETEFVESRIRKITGLLAMEKFAEQNRARVPLVDRLNDTNSFVVSFALEQMAKEWLPAYVDPVTKLMGHDDPGVRWNATQVLKLKVDSSFDGQLKALLKDDDLRKRGLAAYIAVYRWKNDSLEIMKGLLSHDAQLVRYDAISALMIDGGAVGRRVVLAHASNEPNATLKKLIESPKTRE
jgi:Flp pilus assembly protein TadD